MVTRPTQLGNDGSQKQNSESSRLQDEPQSRHHLLSKVRVSQAGYVASLRRAKTKTFVSRATVSLRIEFTGDLLPQHAQLLQYAVGRLVQFPLVCKASAILLGDALK